MASKTEQFRAEAQRKGGGVKRVKKRPTRDPLHTATRNVTRRGDKQVGMALEDSLSGKPSRKSTRPSSHHGRNDVQIMKAATARSQTPTARANRWKVVRKGEPK